MSDTIISRYCVGVDGGGTKCHAVVFDEAARPLGSAKGGPANIAKYGIQALESIEQTVSQAVVNSGLAVDCVAELTVSAGLAGAFIESSERLLSEWQHPFGRFKFTSDITAAVLGAHGGDDGCVIVTGTGSCAALWQGKQLTQFGGYGFTLGDQASGAWLGRVSVQQALLHADGIVTAPLLWQSIVKFYNCHSAPAIVNLLNLAQPAEFARFAPTLFDLATDCPVSQKIIQEGGEYLNGIAQSVTKDSELKLVLTGGLAPRWQPYLAPEIQARLVEPQNGPEWGAMYYARII